MDINAESLGAVGTVVLSSGSLLVSLYVLWRQRQVEGRAHFTAEWESDSTLVYINHGPGAASDVVARLGGRRRPRQDQQIPYMAALQLYRMTHASRSVTDHEATTLQLSWKDNRARRQHITIHLPEPPHREHRTDLEGRVQAIARAEADAQVKALMRTRIPRRP